MANTVKQAFNALTPEQQEIVRSRKFSGKRSPDDWIALLRPVADYDRHADQVRQGGGGFFARRWAKKNDVPNALRTFVYPLLPILREDQDPEVPLELWVDLTGPLQSARPSATRPRTRRAPTARSSTRSTTTRGFRPARSSPTARTSSSR